MRREKSKPYFLIFLFLFLIFLIPTITSEKIRGTVMEMISPIFETVGETKFLVSNSFTPQVISTTPNTNVSVLTEREEIQRLELENKLLYANIIQLLDLIHHEESLNSLYEVVPARVIFRSPSSWYSSLWINVGEETNKQIKENPIGKNSPVLVHDSLIGVIDYFGKKQSRVRLITDSGLTPSVRAVRQENQESHFLAKGEIKGAGNPLYRSGGNILYGIGFNYDFKDEKGPARDLRTGEPTEQKEKYKTLPLLKVGDLLQTTGMDAVFPEGLNVGRITKIYPLKEGDYYYELEAEPTSGNLDDLSLVFVLPPIGFDFNDKPPLIGR